MALPSASWVAACCSNLYLWNLVNGNWRFWNPGASQSEWPVLHLLGSLFSRCQQSARHGGTKHRDHHADVMDGCGNKGELWWTTIGSWGFSQTFPNIFRQSHLGLWDSLAISTSQWLLVKIPPWCRRHRTGHAMAKRGMQWPRGDLETWTIAGKMGWPQSTFIILYDPLYIFWDGWLKHWP